MGCGCKSTHKLAANGVAQFNSYSNRSVTTLPHEILPGASCIFCAEKHVSIAHNIAVTAGIYPGSRQMIIGELELARRHTFVEYASQNASIRDAERQALLRNDTELLSWLTAASESVSERAMLVENGNDTSSPATYKLNTQHPDHIHPLIGEMYFCAAWRLAFECGYERPNRQMIIGDLSMAQVHLYKFSYEIAEKLRDIRHKVQRSEQKLISDDWIVVAQNLDVLITPKITDIKAEYGEDLAWYLEA